MPLRWGAGVSLLLPGLPQSARAFSGFAPFATILNALSMPGVLCLPMLCSLPHAGTSADQSIILHLKWWARELGRDAAGFAAARSRTRASLRLSDSIRMEAEHARSRTWPPGAK